MKILSHARKMSPTSLPARDLFSTPTPLGCVCPSALLGPSWVRQVQHANFLRDLSGSFATFLGVRSEFVSGSLSVRAILSRLRSRFNLASTDFLVVPSLFDPSELPQNALKITRKSRGIRFVSYENGHALRRALVITSRRMC